LKDLEKLNIGFVSTRFAGTDGVSLEAEKWAEVLTEFGHSIYWYAGELDKPETVGHLVPEAFFNHSENLELNSQVFGSQKRSRALTDLIYRRKEFLKNTLYDFIKRFDIDLLVAENALSIPMHIPLGMALTEVIAETGIPTLAHNHDFWWERPRFLLNSVQDIIQSCFPPDLPSVRQVVINSMIQTDLAAKRGLSSTLIPNVLDFDKSRPWFNDFNYDFRSVCGFSEEDLLILQPTRIVSRKGIEQSIYLIKKLDLPNTKLIISHSASDEGLEYYEWVMDVARNQGIDISFIYNRLHETKRYSETGEKLFSLWDVYPHVNLVTYPSTYEGFGNAFLEAVYFRKPLLVNRYSVYIVDIEPKGFDVVSIDGFVTEKAVNRVRDILTREDLLQAMTERNFHTAKKFFSFRILRKRLSALLTSFYGSLSNGDSR